jgi:hypothetical protein
MTPRERRLLGPPNYGLLSSPGFAFVSYTLGFIWLTCQWISGKWSTKYCLFLLGLVLVLRFAGVYILDYLLVRPMGLIIRLFSRRVRAEAAVFVPEVWV